LGTYWQTQKAAGKNKLKEEWIVVDLGAVESVSRVVLEWGNNYATDYSIRVSLDQSQWVTVSATSAGDGGMDEVTFSAASARYIMMNSTSWSSGTWRNALQEFEVYSGSGGTSTPTPTPTPTSTPAPTPTPSPTDAIHIGDLNAFSSAGSRNRWDAVITVLVHDSNEMPVEGVLVNYSWTDGVSGNGTCTTNAEGSCTIQKNNLKANVGSVSLTVVDLEHPNYLYESTMNHNANGDPISSDITVLKP